MSDLQLVTLADRRAVYALLDRMLDWLPPARLSVTRDTSTKPGVGTWRPCGVCAATGRLLGGKPCRQEHRWWPFGHGCRPCPICDGGHILALPPRGQEPTGTDRMLNPGRHDLDTQAQVKAEQRRYIDAQLVKLHALARQRGDARDPITGLTLAAEAPDDELSRALAAKKHLYATGSFTQLEYALTRLQLEASPRYDFIRLTAIEGVVQVTDRLRPHVDAIVDWLGQRMPRPILLPADAVNEVEAWKMSLQLGRTAAHRVQRDARNREIHELAVVHRWSQRKIAAHYALSQPAVCEILAAMETSVATGPVAA